MIRWRGRWQVRWRGGVLGGKVPNKVKTGWWRYRVKSPGNEGFQLVKKGCEVVAGVIYSGAVARNKIHVLQE